MRELKYIPMVHTPELSRASGLELGPGPRATNLFWETVTEAIEQNPVDQPILYIEGYTKPRTEVPAGVMNESDGESTEAKVVAKLLKHGGVIENTEDPELIKNAEDRYKRLGTLYQMAERYYATDPTFATITPDDYEALDSISKLVAEITESSTARTKFVADRIAESLPEGRTGIVLLGANHDIIAELPDDIRVEPLDPRLDEIIAEIKKEIKQPKGQEGNSQKIFEGGGEAKG